MTSHGRLLRHFVSLRFLGKFPVSKCLPDQLLLHKLKIVEYEEAEMRHRICVGPIMIWWIPEKKDGLGIYENKNEYIRTIPVLRIV